VTSVPNPKWNCCARGITILWCSETAFLLVGRHSYDSGVERGIRNVSLLNIEKIARGLKKSVPDQFGRG